ncbi:MULTISPECIES: hypothetical protein [Rothia]|uniref:Uncharacterized protein n=1 Tax=Rothia endophytica TaxID=1324766 RepID=A0ABP9BUN5_9MICC|nr:hypothetical protein [Rothia nasisuis]
MSKKKKSLASTVTGVILGLIVVGAVLLSFIDNSGAQHRVCTVVSAELKSNSSGGSRGPVPTTSVLVETEECGNLSVSKMNTPAGMNEAGLAEFLAANVGKKFEFNVMGLSLGNDMRSSDGITSTTPVE